VFSERQDARFTLDDSEPALTACKVAIALDDSPKDKDPSIECKLNGALWIGGTKIETPSCHGEIDLIKLNPKLLSMEIRKFDKDKPIEFSAQHTTDKDGKIIWGRPLEMRQGSHMCLVLPFITV
jgi:hypothetical protein